VWTAPTTMKAADAARRVGMGEVQFREVNRIPPRMLIKAGSTLLVPRGASQQKDVSEQVADNGQISLAPEIVLVKQSVKLRKAESVASVAKRYKVTPAALAGWNHISAGGSFKAKQAVVLYLPKKAHTARAGKAARGGKVVARSAHGSKAAPSRASKVVKKPRKR
jgi:membrane-bound lytic murein transglycosylase D